MDINFFLIPRSFSLARFRVSGEETLLHKHVVYLQCRTRAFPGISIEHMFVDQYQRQMHVGPEEGGHRSTSHQQSRSAGPGGDIVATVLGPRYRSTQWFRAEMEVVGTRPTLQQRYKEGRADESALTQVLEAKHFRETANLKPLSRTL